ARAGLDVGRELASATLLYCLGRTARLDGLDVAAAGLRPGRRGTLGVDESFRTAVPHIDAVGDVIGPPALAATAMEQGRRAACHALGLDGGGRAHLTPVGVYTIPEMACVGADERVAGGAIVGRAPVAAPARRRLGRTGGRPLQPLGHT